MISKTILTRVPVFPLAVTFVLAKNDDGKLARCALAGALFGRLDVNTAGFVAEDEAEMLWKDK